MVRNNTNNRRLNGLYTLAYMGDNPTTPPDFYSVARDPLTTDNQFYICDMWLNTITHDCWLLVALTAGVATWIKFAGGTGDILTITGNTGGPVPPTAAGNINVVGDGIGITIAGNPGTNTLTASLIGGGQALRTLTASDATVATESGGNITFPDAVIAGSLNVDSNLISHGAGSNFTLNLKPIINLPNTNTTGTAGVIYLNGNRFISNYLNTPAVGINSGNFTSTGLFGSAFGNSVLSSLTSGTSDSGFGNGALQSVTTGSDNSCFGFVAGNLISTSSFNSCFGSGAGITLTTGASNTLFGYTAGGNYVGAETNNICIGSQVQGIAAESNVIRIGTGTTHTYISNTYSDFGTANVFVGSGAGNLTLTTGSAVSNSSVGQLTLQSLTTGNNNSAFGWANLVVCTTGDSNTACGSNVLTSLTTGSANTALGNAALSNPGGGLVTGSNNIAIGSGAGTNYTGAESSNILLSNAGTLGESNHIRLGTTGGGANQQNKCWIAAIRGVTTDVNDAIAVLIDSTGQLGTVSSSERYKENIRDFGETGNAVYDLRPRLFNYKTHPGTISYGLIAEEVEKVIPALVVYNSDGLPETVKYHELPVLLLLEIQKLNKRLTELEAKNS